MIRRSCLLATALCLAIVACDDDDQTTSPTTGFANVRFINATNTNISVVNNGTIATNNTRLAFGDRSTCLDVTANASGGSGLRFTNEVTGTVISSFTTSFTAGGNYTVVAYTDASGTTQFAILNNAFTPTSGQAGVRFFNAANAGTLTLRGNGRTFSGNSSIALGLAGTFLSVAAGSQTVTFNNGTTNVLDAGAMNFTAGQNTTILIGPPMPGTTGYRFFTATGC